jgi:hypothetical protein
MEPPVLTTLAGGISLLWLMSRWPFRLGGRRGTTTALFLAAMPLRQHPKTPRNAGSADAASPAH